MELKPINPIPVDDLIDTMMDYTDTLQAMVDLQSKTLDDLGHTTTAAEKQLIKEMCVAGAKAMVAAVGSATPKTEDEAAAMQIAYMVSSQMVEEVDSIIASMDAPQGEGN